MKRKFFTLCIALLLVMASVIGASAEAFEPEKTGSITVTLAEQYEKAPIVGAELCVYYIATVSVNAEGNLSYSYTEDFAGTGIPLDDPDLASKLAGYLSENDIPVFRLYTNPEGTASCDNLPLGLYFVLQTNEVEGFAPCTPFLVTVPATSSEGYVYEVNATPKTEVAKLTDIIIIKVWNTDDSAKATDSVTVQLLRDGNLVATAILNDENNWQTTYTNMPESDAYSIIEVDVPKGFTATYKQSGYVFTVINTSSLIQTGQLIWPIPLLAFLGILLIAGGCVLLQKKRNRDA